MDINLPIKIHNRFDIEVKDINTGEIVQRGCAENIILDNVYNSSLFASSSSSNYIGKTIRFGKGTGIISSSRTTLFEQLGSKDSPIVEAIFNQVPLISYSTKKIVLLPAEYVGERITEVGIGDGDGTTIYTHALIKDSEGNPLELGPKTDTQEITIYRTVYFVPNFESGIELVTYINYNAILLAGTFHSEVYAKDSNSHNIGINNSITSIPISFSRISNGVMTSGVVKLLTTHNNNTKIKTISDHTGSSTKLNKGALLNLEILAQNNSTMWGGYEFDNTPVGIGDGNTTIFNLMWDEAWLDKPYAVYVDGIVQLSGVAFDVGNITFDIAPADGAVITADYWVKYIPKDDNHEAWITFNYNFSEGSES